MSFARHFEAPLGRGALPDAPHAGAAGGGACGDLIRVAVRVEGDRIAEAGYEVSGCGAVQAAGSAVVELVEGTSVLEGAMIDASRVSDALGGLTPAKRHAADLAADAFHRALGTAARDGALSLSASGRRTLVAMSGGVDSAAAAQLALDAGDEVVAVTLELWADPATDGEKSCCSPQAVTGARSLAQRMGIPHFTLDVRDRFREQVVDDFLAGYGAGRTPNPCVRCNGFVRFDAMLDLAASLGAARLATGHYARVGRDGEGALVRAAVDPRKDQSYMLARLGSEQLERLSFPLGGLHKPAVRELARDAGLPVADKRESQDLCFLAGSGRRAFMRRHGGRSLAAVAGEIVDSRGSVLGRHDGHHEFTIGQRRGIGVGGGEPLYVLAKDAAKNRVVVGSREELARDRVQLGEVTLHRPFERVRAARLRYRSEPIACRAVERAGGVELELERPAQAVAPGQVACLMDGELVVGCGTIED
ncbi:MAG TPA: tRNA 2-thiouridine(34) synthase MnmA [Thermoleophilaceae bacterium]|jgi:tRNA-specific 2-thiouridylase